MNNRAVVRAGVLGANGYTGREAVRLLARHPRVEIVFATSQSEAGHPLRSLDRAAPELALVRAEDAELAACDVVLSCLPHGESARWAERALAAGARVVDLSADLRVPGADTPEWARGAVYGLPELHRERIAGAGLVANPGCYPTAALLALAPLLRAGLLAGPAIVNAASGVTGAGRSPKRELLFAEVAEDFRAYGVGNTHRHLETIHVTLREPLEDPEELWAAAYADEPFVEVTRGRTPSLADVVGSNRVAVGVAAVAGVSAPMLTVVAAIDNLVKGAAGQAVQNLNLMSGLPETEGLL